MNAVSMVLLFNTCAPAHLAARLHSSRCPMVVHMGSRRGRRTPVQVCEASAEVIADLNERGWPVRRCRCLSREQP